MSLNKRIEVSDGLFMSRWWEVAARAVFFMLGASYSSIFGHILSEDSYIGIPLLLVALGILFGRYQAEKKREAIEHKHLMAEIMEMELEHQRSMALLNSLSGDWMQRINQLNAQDKKSMLALLEKMNAPTKPAETQATS